MARDPLNKTFQRHLVNSLWRNGQVEDAREVIIKSLDFDNNYQLMIRRLFTIKLYVDNNIVEANRLIDKLFQIESDSLRYRFRKAQILAVEGKRDEAL